LVKMKDDTSAGTGWLTVSIRLPKSLHAFMDKFAALEGYHAEDWYTDWIRGDFESFLNEFSGLDVDMRTLIDVNDLKGELEDRNPGFVRRILHEEQRVASFD
jgi:hypothetical protein